MSARFYEFGRFRIDALNHVLLRDGETLPLKPKVFDTLVVLVENRERVLDKDELMKRLWPDTIVEEANLTQNIYLLRKVLGEETDGEQYIETMPKRGYRFVATVNEVVEGSADLISERHVRARVLIEEEHGAKSFSEIPNRKEQPSITTLPNVRWKKNWRSAVMLALVAVVLLGTSLTIMLPRLRSRPQLVNGRLSIRSIAVLPFKALSSDPSDDYLGLGMADTLITRLSSINQIDVRQTSAVRKFTAPDQDAAAVGRELKVDAVLESSLQRKNDQIRVTLRLVSTTDGSTVWADQVDEQGTDSFAVQDRVAEKVARALLPQVSVNDRNLLTKHYTQNPEAHNLYMKGRFQWYASATNPARKKKAIEFFQQALEKDPDFALAYCALADAYVDLAADVPPLEVMPKAKEAALNAMRIDYNVADSHRSLGNVKAYYEWDWTGAEEEFKRAIDLSPNSMDAHQNYGLFLSAIGRATEGIAEAKRSQELGGPSSGVLFALAGAREFDQLQEESREAIKTDPGNPYLHLWSALVHEVRGMKEEAIAELEQANRLSSGSTIMKAQLGYAYAAAGKKDQAQAVLSELKALADQRYVSSYDIALVYLGLGDKNQTFAWLEKAYQERARRLWALKVNPSWDKVRSDPRFADLLRRINLAL